MNYIIKNVLYSLSALFVSKVVGFFSTFFIVKILGPSHYGVWVTVFIVASYAPIACLGTGEAMLKQVPFFMGRGESDKIRDVEGSVLGSIVLAAAFLLLLGFSALVALPMYGLQEYIPLIRMVLAASAVSYFTSFFYYRFVAHEDFKHASLIDSLRSILFLLLVVGLAWRWGLLGAAGGFLITEVILCAISISLSLRHQGAFDINFRRSLLAKAVRIGFPITIVWWIFTLQSTADRIISAAMLGREATGYYGLGMSFVVLIAIVPRIIGRVLYPSVNRQLGVGKGAEGMESLVVLPTRAISVILPLVLVVCLLALPFIYSTWLPEYLPGLVSAQILIVGAFFISIIKNGSNYLIAVNEQSVFLKYVLISLVANVAGNITFVKLGFGIEGIALCTSLSGALLTSCIWWRVFATLGYAVAERSLGVFFLYAPLFVLIGILAGLRLFAEDLLTTTRAVDLWRVVAIALLYVSTILIVPRTRTECVQLFHWAWPKGWWKTLAAGPLADT